MVDGDQHPKRCTLHAFGKYNNNNIYKNNNNNYKKITMTIIYLTESLIQIYHVYIIL